MAPPYEGPPPLVAGGGRGALGLVGLETARYGEGHHEDGDIHLDVGVRNAAREVGERAQATQVGSTERVGLPHAELEVRVRSAEAVGAETEPVVRAAAGAVAAEVGERVAGFAETELGAVQHVECQEGNRVSSPERCRADNGGLVIVDGDGRRRADEVIVRGVAVGRLHGRPVDHDARRARGRVFADVDDSAGLGDGRAHGDGPVRVPSVVVAVAEAEDVVLPARDGVPVGLAFVRVAPGEVTAGFGLMHGTVLLGSVAVGGLSCLSSSELVRIRSCLVFC